MAGDIGISEHILILPRAQELDAVVPDPAQSLAQGGGRIMHRYGDRVVLAELPAGADSASIVDGIAALADLASPDIPDDLTEVERLGVEAFALRRSADYAAAKANRPLQGESWDGPEGTTPLMCADIGAPPGSQALLADAGAPVLSARLTGQVAVGIVIVDGPTPELQFTAQERTKVVAEVQNGLGWLGAQSTAGTVSFSYDVRSVAVAEAPLDGMPTSEQMEAVFRDPAMATLGYAVGLAGVAEYAGDLRSRLRTDWAYIGFFTKYPLGHFAYASIGGPRLVMQYANDGWGPDNIDRVFTHESGHIFGAPDEYAASQCQCGGSWGHFGRPNSNCELCAPGGGVKCLMRGNDWQMCADTPLHLGFATAQGG